MKKKLYIFLIILLAGTFAFWIKFLYTPLVNHSGYRFTVPAGASMKTVVNDLYDKGIIKNYIFFSTLVRLRGDSHSLKAGEYFFPEGTTPSKMLNQMVTGTGIVYRAFTIVPGWNFKDLSDALFKNTSIRHQLPHMTHQDLMKVLGRPDLDPEGQFFPDTYFFAEGTYDIVILKRSFKAMQTKLNTAWLTRDVGLPYQTPNEALIAASLIEKEAYLAEEQPRIAGVLMNRLQKDMLLQFDPTVIYGMGMRYNGTITKEDLLENTPYNTYVHKGLPPTPIAMPSLGAIIAALHPELNNYLYFVARGDGSHQFSETLSDHNDAVMDARKPWFFNEDLLSRRLFKLHK
ncbi:MAG TPA: endolytic transglycosylase MltG [Gammaproteobacteria bacterium]|jgi:UPF0755 protein|nr:endolytic transglycosylase MltG [Gammaproteobacteria bacterium]